MLRTKKQEKAICKDCPIAKTANLVGDSCTLVIVRDLLSGPKRFGELEKSLQGVSTRTLTKKLGILVAENLIDRKEYIGKPPHVEYSLTKKGEGLHDLTEAMRVYGEKHLI
jgi:DNA-binding HxlR family transcriptional regulator